MSEATPLTREPDLWFKDGNLVIQVFPRLFRLHRGVLASHTNFFRDMVQFPESSEQDMYDEVPLVILHDDDARDAVHFFKAIYVFHYFLPPPAKTTLAIIEGVLRLSHKYDAPMLRRCALQHLCVTFVTDLPDMRHDPYRTYLCDDESEELAEFKLS
ncbi:uncharacterized protein SCHCODRAFT_02606999 [Schizophyllum commune H4-8]|nr:uncharacterized protein SCHCODRAFT_02606999 [Schizophyllum commune H4-8]KAI5900105.1 hypothetical protein SCHCODRAFT_02606999 [Schizophyllum commune H4-8]